MVFMCFRFNISEKEIFTEWEKKQKTIQRWQSMLYNKRKKEMKEKVFETAKKILRKRLI